jgi:hypothetical protein
MANANEDLVVMNGQSQIQDHSAFVEHCTCRKGVKPVIKNLEVEEC